MSGEAGKLPETRYGTHYTSLNISPYTFLLHYFLLLNMQHFVEIIRDVDVYSSAGLNGPVLQSFFRVVTRILQTPQNSVINF